MNKDKWEVIKSKFELTLKSWEIDKKCNQFTVDSICSVFPTEIEAIIGYINDLEDRTNKAVEMLEKYPITSKLDSDYILVNDLLEILKGGTNE